MSKAQHVFVPNKELVWELVEVISVDDAGGTVSVQGGADTHAPFAARLFKLNEVVQVRSQRDLKEGSHSDLVKLTDVHRPGIFYALQKRFLEDSIYTAIGPVLISINPFKWIKGLYDHEVMNEYSSGDSNLSDHPHIFAISCAAMNGLQQGKSQSLIISGESGAGKTEATKQCLAYLAAQVGRNARLLEAAAAGNNDSKDTSPAGQFDIAADDEVEKDSIQEKILKASPILEAWGNAKTNRNDNSSRFGKFIEIWFGPNQKKIIRSVNTTYLLEKSRIVSQEPNERNYHIFYQFLKGYDSTKLEDLGLKEISRNPLMSKFLGCGQCVAVPGVDDLKNFKEMSDAMESLSFSNSEQDQLMNILAGIILLGQVEFRLDAEDKAAITPESRKWIGRASMAFKVSDEMLKKALLFTAMQTGKDGRKGSIIYKGYDLVAARENLRALVKEIYCRCFDWIVSKVNKAINVPSNQAPDGTEELPPVEMQEENGFIGILDIFGFEIFARNSLEQLCINLANENLQQHFNFHIFKGEMSLYESEGIVVPKLQYVDNQDALDLIMKPKIGLFPILDEEGQIPRGSDEGFLSKIIKQYAPDDLHKVKTMGGFSGNNHPRFNNSSGGKTFFIVHYAGRVEYTPTGFLTKNNDKVSKDGLELMMTSQITLLSRIFTNDSSTSNDTGLMEKQGTKDPKLKVVKMTVTRKFSLQLDSLIAQLNTTVPHYIRCIKPNNDKLPGKSDPVAVNEQLTYSGVFEAVQIMQSGYPCRLSHKDFASRYHMIALSILPESESAADAAPAPKQRRKANIGNAMKKSGLVSYDHIFGRRKGTVNSRNEGAKFSHTANAKTSQELVSVFALERNMKLCEGCYVGKTKVFYRAEQSLLMDEKRNIIRNIAIVTLQRWLRGAISRRYSKPIMKGLKNAHHAVQSKNILLIAPIVASTELSENIVKFESLLSKAIANNRGSVSYSNGGGYGLEVNQQVLRIAKDLLEHLESHARLKKALKTDLDSIASGERSMYDVFDVLESNLHLMQNENFLQNGYPSRNEKFSLNWNDDFECTKMGTLIEKYAKIVHLKNRFDQNMVNVDENQLMRALEDLHSLRKTGEIDSKFCAEEAKFAVDIINQATNIFNVFMGKVIKAFPQGALEIASGDAVVTQGDKDVKMFVFEVKVTSAPLVEVMNEWQNRVDLHTKSVQTVSLMEFVNSQINLRGLAETEQWSALWVALQARTTVAPKATDSWTSLLSMDTEHRQEEFDRDYLANASKVASHVEFIPDVEPAAAPASVPSLPEISTSVGLNNASSKHVASSNLSSFGFKSIDDANASFDSEGGDSISGLLDNSMSEAINFDNTQLDDRGYIYRDDKRYRKETQMQSKSVKHVRKATQKVKKTIIVSETIMVDETVQKPLKLKRAVMKKKMVPVPPSAIPPPPPLAPAAPPPASPVVSSPQPAPPAPAAPPPARARIAQLFNVNLAAFYIDMDTGVTSWELNATSIVTLPDESKVIRFRDLLYLSHADEEEGEDAAAENDATKIYYENIRTREVAWTPPFPEMSLVAIEKASELMSLDLESCEALISVGENVKKRFDHEASMQLLLDIDKYVEYLQDLTDKGADEDQATNLVVEELAPAASPSPAVPDLSKWKRMQNLNIPEQAIRNKMRQEGMSDVDVNNFFKGIDSARPPPPPAPLAPPPPAPSSAPFAVDGPPKMIEVEYASEEEYEEMIDDIIQVAKLVDVTREVEVDEEIDEEYDSEEEVEVEVEVEYPLSPEPDPEPDPEPPKTLTLFDKIRAVSAMIPVPDSGSIDYSSVYIKTLESCSRVNGGIMVPRFVENLVASDIRRYITACLHFEQFQELTVLLRTVENKITDAISYGKECSVNFVKDESKGGTYVDGGDEAITIGEHDIYLTLDSTFNIDLYECNVISPQTSRLSKLTNQAADFIELFSSQQDKIFGESNAVLSLLNALSAGDNTGSNGSEHVALVKDAVSDVLASGHMNPMSGLLRVAQAFTSFGDKKEAFFTAFICDGPTDFNAVDKEKSGKGSHRPSFMAFEIISHIGLEQALSEVRNGIPVSILVDNMPLKFKIRFENALWQELLALSECLCTVRLATGEIDSEKFNGNSVALLTAQEKEDFTCIVSLLDAFQENESWFSRYFENEKVVGKQTATTTANFDANKLSELDRVASILNPSLSKNIITDSKTTWTLQQFVQFALVEMNQSRKELLHLLAISYLAESLRNGAVTGVPGNINKGSIDSQSLENAIVKATRDIIVSPFNSTLIKDAQLLVSLRKECRIDDWDEIGRVVNPLLNTHGPTFYMKFHPNCQEEMLLLSKELADHMSKKYLNSAIGLGVMTLEKLNRLFISGGDEGGAGVNNNNTNKYDKSGKKNKKVDKGSRVESPLLDDRVLSINISSSTDLVKGQLRALQEAIAYAEACVFQSDEVKQLLFDAKISLALREAVANNRWEAPVAIDLQAEFEGLVAGIGVEDNNSSSCSEHSSIYHDSDSESESSKNDESDAVKTVSLSWGSTSMQQLHQILQYRSPMNDYSSSKEKNYDEFKITGLQGLESDDPLLSLFQWSLIEDIKVDSAPNSPVLKGGASAPPPSRNAAGPGPPPPPHAGDGAPPPPPGKGAPPPPPSMSKANVPAAPSTGVTLTSSGSMFCQTLRKESSRSSLALNNRTLAEQRRQNAANVIRYIEKLEAPLSRREGGRKDIARTMRLIASCHKQLSTDSSSSSSTEKLFVSDILAYLQHVRQSKQQLDVHNEMRATIRSQRAGSSSSAESSKPMSPIKAYLDSFKTTPGAEIDLGLEDWETRIDDVVADPSVKSGTMQDADIYEDDDEQNENDLSIDSAFMDTCAVDFTHTPTAASRIVSLLGYKRTANDMTNREIQLVFNLAYERRARVVLWSTIRAGSIENIEDLMKHGTAYSHSSHHNHFHENTAMASAIHYVEELFANPIPNCDLQIGYGNRPGENISPTYGVKLSPAVKAWMDTHKQIAELRRSICTNHTDIRGSVSINTLQELRVLIVRNRYHPAMHEINALTRGLVDLAARNRILKALSVGGPKYTSTSKFKGDASNIIITDITACLKENENKQSTIDTSGTSLHGQAGIDALLNREYIVEAEENYEDLTAELLADATAKAKAKAAALAARRKDPNADTPKITQEHGHHHHHRTSHSHSKSQIREHKVYKSPALDRLVIYAELALDMREGLIQNRWGSGGGDGSMKSSGNGVCATPPPPPPPPAPPPPPPPSTQASSSGPTLRQLYTVFQEITASFKKSDEEAAQKAVERGEKPTYIPEMPAVLAGNFAMIKHELDKFDLMNEYPDAFRSGCPGGSALDLHLNNVSVDAIGRILVKTERWHRYKLDLPIPDNYKSVMDVDIERYYLAAKEVISYRKELMKLYQTFTRPIGYVPPQHEFNAQSFLAHSTIIQSAVSKAVDHITHLFSMKDENSPKDGRKAVPPTNRGMSGGNKPEDGPDDGKQAAIAVIHMWDGVAEIITKCVYAPQIPALQYELHMLQEETLARNYIQSTIAIFKKANRSEMNTPIQAPHIRNIQGGDTSTSHANPVSNEPINFSIAGSNGDTHSTLELIRELCSNNESLQYEFSLLNKKTTHRLLKMSPKVENLVIAVSLLTHLLRAQLLTNAKLCLDGIYGEDVPEDHETQYKLVMIEKGQDIGDLEMSAEMSDDESDVDANHETKSSASHDSNNEREIRKQKQRKILRLNKRVHSFRTKLEDIQEPSHAHWIKAHPSGYYSGASETELPAFANETPRLAVLTQTASSKAIWSDLFSMLALTTEAARWHESGFNSTDEIAPEPHSLQDESDSDEDFIGNHGHGDMKEAQAAAPAKASKGGHLSYASMLLQKETDMVLEQRRRIYSVQSILRCYIQHTGQFNDNDDKFALGNGGSFQAMGDRYLHPVVQYRFHHAIMDTNDEVHKIELVEALQSEEGKARGSPGQLDVKSIDPAPLRAVLAKLNSANDTKRAENKLKAKMQKFVRMAKMLPLSVVRVRMAQDDVPEEDINEFMMEMMLLEATASQEMDGRLAPRCSGNSNVSAANKLDRRQQRKEELDNLIRSCEIIAQMRELIKLEDYSGGFELLEMFISPIKAPPGGAATSSAGTSFGDGSHSFSSHSFYSVVHNSAREEFEVLTMDICTGFWQSIEGTNLAPGIYLRIYTSLLMLSEQSPAMHTLCSQSIRLIDQSKSAAGISLSGNKHGHHQLSAAGAASAPKSRRDSAMSIQDTPKAHLEPSETSPSGKTGNRKEKAITQNRLPPLKNIPNELKPCTPAELEARQHAGEIDYNLQISSPSDPYFSPIAGRELMNNYSQTDGTAILDIVDPMYHKMHGELVRSREDAQNKLGFMRAEKERLLQILQLREKECAEKVAKEERDALNIILKLWENDAAHLEKKRSNIQAQRLETETQDKTSKKIEKNVFKLDRARTKGMYGVAKDLAKHHRIVVEKRKVLAEGKTNLQAKMLKLVTMQEQIRGISLNIAAESEIVAAYLQRQENALKKMRNSLAQQTLAATMASEAEEKKATSGVQQNRVPFNST